MRIFFVKYKPLITTKGGNEAIQQYDIPPYVDGSCRREPDFQSKPPAITATCRGPNFAPRLKKGDWAVYFTFPKRYPGYHEPHWRFTAILEVSEDPLHSHEQGARWYEQRHLPLPSNCMVERNRPLPLDRTIRRIPLTKFPQKYIASLLPVISDPIVAAWDQTYKMKIGQKRCGVFLICKPLHLNLQDPPIITDKDLFSIIGEEKAKQQTPPEISLAQLNALKQICGIA